MRTSQRQGSRHRLDRAIAGRLKTSHRLPARPRHRRFRLERSRFRRTLSFRPWTWCRPPRRFHHSLTRRLRCSFLRKPRRLAPPFPRWTACLRLRCSWCHRTRCRRVTMHRRWCRLARGFRYRRLAPRLRSSCSSNPSAFRKRSGRQRTRGQRICRQFGVVRESEGVPALSESSAEGRTEPPTKAESVFPILCRATHSTRPSNSRASLSSSGS